MLASVADAEFNSDRVPKSQMTRSAGVMKSYKEHHNYTTGNQVKQMSCIIGSVPPRPHMRRNYCSRSSVHAHPDAQVFIKAMLKLAKESEMLIREIMPEQYERQYKLLQAVPEKWRFGNLFTSSISNYNISAAYHRDTGNIVGACNVIICKKVNAVGGNFNLPEYGATIGQEDCSVLVYPAWLSLHGVTPIVPTFEGGYRNTLIFYPLKAFMKH